MVAGFPITSDHILQKGDAPLLVDVKLRIHHVDASLIQASISARTAISRSDMRMIHTAWLRVENAVRRLIEHLPRTGTISQRNLHGLIELVAV